MSFHIAKITAQNLEQYATVPMVVHVDAILRVEPQASGLGGLVLCEEKIEQPYVKDYDADVGNAPKLWAGQFDLDTWGIFLGMQNGLPIAGITIACGAADLCDGREDLAVLWDIRVHPDHKQRGVGSEIFQQGVMWARAQGCQQLKIETQNINVPACRFYAKQGCHLGAIHQYAYRLSPNVTHEVMLLWYLDL